MQDEQWHDTVTRIEDTFRVLQHDVIHGDEVSGDTEIIEFETPQGKMKLERTSKPRIIGKSGITSNRMSSGASIKYEYSATERIHHVTAFRWNTEADDWAAIDLKGGF